MNAFNTRSFLIVILTAAFMLLTACSNMTKEQTGTLVGGAAGAALGSQVGSGSGRLLATVGGALAGGFLGSKIGQSMDAKDQANTAQALNTDQTKSWQNTSTNNSYTVTPTNSYQSAQGETCRQFVMDANVHGQVQQSQQTACKQPDGTWKIQG